MDGAASVKERNEEIIENRSSASGDLASRSRASTFITRCPRTGAAHRLTLVQVFRGRHGSGADERLESGGKYHDDRDEAGSRRCNFVTLVACSSALAACSFIASPLDPRRLAILVPHCIARQGRARPLLTWVGAMEEGRPTPNTVHDLARTAWSCRTPWWPLAGHLLPRELAPATPRTTSLPRSRATFAAVHRSATSPPRRGLDASNFATGRFAPG